MDGQSLGGVKAEIEGSSSSGFLAYHVLRDTEGVDKLVRDMGQLSAQVAHGCRDCLPG